MVDSVRQRYFDSRFFQFLVPVLIIKLAFYVIHLQNMDEYTPNTVTIRKGNSSATFHLFGATLTSWIVDDKELLFVSKKSLFDGRKAIRGGIPVVFPHFGPWDDGPQHGFARISRWSLKPGFQSGSDSVTLVLEDSQETRKFWPYRFRFEYTVSLVSEKKIKMDVIITNTGEDEFSFTFLLHTYFSVPDISSCSVTGLKGCTYIDKVKGGKQFVEDRDEINISEFTDRIYQNTPMTLKVDKLSGKREAKIEKFNLPDTVIWNPWIENAKSMSDFGDDEWKSMICVEAGFVSSPVALNVMKSYEATQIIEVN